MDKNDAAKDRAPLISLEAVTIIRHCPKLSATGGSSHSCPNYAAYPVIREYFPAQVPDAADARGETNSISNSAS